MQRAEGEPKPVNHTFTVPVGKSAPPDTNCDRCFFVQKTRQLRFAKYSPLALQLRMNVSPFDDGLETVALKCPRCRPYGT
jgi:hypothetical protein